MYKSFWRFMALSQTIILVLREEKKKATGNESLAGIENIYIKNVGNI